MHELPHQGFYYPLNVFFHVILHEEGQVEALHYGLFQPGETSLLAAQRSSTELALTRLPPPPARLLEVGFGLGDTLARLTSLGYQALGIGPDRPQYDLARQRHGPKLDLTCIALEELGSEAGPYDVVLFQESAQYIEPQTLFERVRQVLRPGGRAIVLDEFRLDSDPSLPGALPELSVFQQAATGEGFRLIEEVDLSSAAAPTVDWFLSRLPCWRDRLVTELGLEPSQIDDLLTSGANYRAGYARGALAYRLMVLER